MRGGRAAAGTAALTALLLSAVPAAGDVRDDAHGAGADTAGGMLGATLTDVGTVRGPGAARPGPDLLYRTPPTDPGTAPAGRFVRPPTGVSGTTVVADGELVWTGWPYDDHGPDTIPLPLLNELLGADPSVTDQLFSARTGDLIYPTDPPPEHEGTDRGRYATNAADLVEVRVRPDADGLAFRFTLNTLTEPGLAAVAVGLDLTGSDDDVDWGRGLGRLGPTGVDRVLWTDGVDADLDGEPLETTVRRDRGVVEVTVPDELLPLTDDDQLELYAVSGLSDGDGGFVAAGARPTADAPGGDPTGTAPPVFDVAFRADEQEPAGLLDLEGRSAQAATFGSWRSHAMATALADRDISPFAARLDVGAVRAGEVASDVPEAGTVQRTYWSRFDLGDGIGTERPLFRGNRQPYTLHVPSCVAEGDIPTLTLALHSLGGNHGQYLAASPGFYDQLGQDRCSLVVTPLGRGPDGWYLDEAEADLFEVLADVVASYDVDLAHTLIHGYSMGGYGTYRLVGRYPDLFAAAFPVVGPPSEGAVLLAGDAGLPLGFSPATGTVDPSTDTTPLLSSFRHVPMLAWHGTADQLVPVTSAVTHLQTMAQLGYHHRHELFVADHFLLATVDDWTRATEVLGERPELVVDPDHVTYRIDAARDRADLGLVADHAYWLSDLTVRDVDAGGLVDVRTAARGVGDRTSSPIVDAGPAPLPFVARGLTLGDAAEVDAEPRVEVDLTGVATATVDLTAGRLPLDDEATVTVGSDGSATLTLVLADAARVVEVDGAGQVVAGDGGPVLVVEVEDGDAEVVLTAGDGDGTVARDGSEVDGGDTGDGTTDGGTSDDAGDGATQDAATRGEDAGTVGATVQAGTSQPLPVTGGGPTLLGLAVLAAGATLRRAGR